MTRFIKPTLLADTIDGEGSLGNFEKFRKLDSLMRLDILGDWIHDLKNELKIAHKDFYGKYEGKSK